MGVVMGLMKNRKGHNLKTRLRWWDEGGPQKDSRDYFHDEYVLDTIYRRKQIRIIRPESIHDHWRIIYVDKGSGGISEWIASDIKDVCRLIRREFK